MTWIFTKISELGEWLVSLSPRTRMQIVSVGLLLLGGGAVYKLIISIEEMKKPLPTASPGELIKPMEQLIRQTSAQANTYQLSRQRNQVQLDSLKKIVQTRPNP